MICLKEDIMNDSEISVESTLTSTSTPLVLASSVTPIMSALCTPDNTNSLEGDAPALAPALALTLPTVPTVPTVPTASQKIKVGNSTNQCFQHIVEKWYNIKKNKRVFVNYTDKDKSGNIDNTSKTVKKRPSFKFSYAFNMIPQLTEEYRARHNLSLADYRKIFKGMSVNHMWLMALYHGLEVTTSAVQSANLQTDVMKYGNNNQYKKKLEEFLKPNLSKTDRLIGARDKHKLPLPLHFVSEEMLNSIPKPAKKYDHIFEWKNIYVVPYDYYNGYVKMVSVVPKFIYEKVYNKAKNLISQPFEYFIDGLVWCTLFEYFLLQTVENHELLVNMDNHHAKQYEKYLFKRKVKKSL